MIALRTFSFLAIVFATCVFAIPDKPAINGAGKNMEKGKMKPNWRRPPPHKRELSNEIISQSVFLLYSWIGSD